VAGILGKQQHGEQWAAAHDNSKVRKASTAGWLTPRRDAISHCQGHRSTRQQQGAGGWRCSARERSSQSQFRFCKTSTMASTTTPAPLLPVTSTDVGCGSVPPSSATGLSNTALATLAFCLFVSRLAETARRLLADRRLWMELLDQLAFSRPDSLSEATSWLRHNLVAPSPSPSFP
jgi:hypothetical protein